MLDAKQQILRKLATAGRCQYSTTEEHNAALMLQYQGLVKVETLIENDDSSGCKVFGIVEAIPLFKL